MKTPFAAIAMIGCLALTLSACGKPQSQAPVAAAAPRQSYQEIMQNEVDAPADVFWGASGSVIDGAGDHSLVPKTEADWARVRQAVQTLIAASDKLTTPGRPLVQPGQKIGDEGQESVASPDWIRTAFVEQRPLFLQRAGALKTLGDQALVAVDHRDLKAIDEIGQQLDAACESCHESFWYPPSARTPRKTPLVLPATPPPPSF